MCKGRLATSQKSTSKLLKPIVHTINLFKEVPLEMAKAQLMCRKPSSQGLIYQYLTENHLKTPAWIYNKVTGEDCSPEMTLNEMLGRLQKYPGVKWGGGMDFGYTHNFAFVWGFTYGKTSYVCGCVHKPELDPSEQVAECQPAKKFKPSVWPDTASPQMIKVFKRQGWRMMDWDKAAHSVIDGINIVRLKIRPAIGEPELYFANVEDARFLWNQMSKYHWTIDAQGNLSRTPDEEGDDEPDRSQILDNERP